MLKTLKENQITITTKKLRHQIAQSNIKNYTMSKTNRILKMINYYQFL